MRFRVPHHYAGHGVCGLSAGPGLRLPNGFCGACATLYRAKGKQELKSCLACQTQVEEGDVRCHPALLPLVKQVYDMESIP